MKALQDEYPIVRHEAISALGMIGASNAREALEKFLDCKSPYLRHIAAKAMIEISGVPEAEVNNLKLLFKLLSSEDARIERTILQMGHPALVFLASKLDNPSFSVSQYAARTIALHIRIAMDQLPPKQQIFPWMAKHEIFPQTIADLYRFGITRKGILVDKVDNTGFDRISQILCGDKNILLHKRTPPIVHCDAEALRIDLKSFLAEYGADRLEIIGRTLIAPVDEGFLALKLCIDSEDKQKLLFEARMLKYLKEIILSSTLPCPLGGLFRIRGLPLHVLDDLKLKDPYAICYIANRSYLTYLNDPRLSMDDLKRGLSSCAQDLARLTRRGLIHTSLIPLFHKKHHIASEDIDYQWNRKIAGRLERWLESCRYPNLRLSGIADFEHVELHPEISPQELQSHIGGHLLSLSLVLGSYFRYKGEFDQKALKSIMSNCFREYYCALTTMPSRLDEAIDWDELALQMVEEMGFDGYIGNDLEDIDGPHLGVPRGPFPIPELIKAIHVTSIISVMEMQACIRLPS